MTYTAKRRAEVLARMKEQLAKDASLGVACSECNLGHVTPYMWAKVYPEWRELIESFRRTRRTVYGVEFVPGTKREQGGAV